MIRFGPYQLDRDRGLWRGTEFVRLTPKAMSLLCVLVEQAGELVTKEELFRAVWKDTAVGDCALTSCIQELRHALADDPRSPRFIQTLHRRGYRFIAGISDEKVEDARIARSGAPPRMHKLLVGRDAVLHEMCKAIPSAHDGSRQVLFVTGEAGIGKTSVAEVFLDRLEARHGFGVACGTCIQHYGVGEPYEPLLEALTRLCRQEGGAQFISVLERYGPTWLAQLPALVPARRLARLQQSAVGVTRARMLRELNDVLEIITTEAPLALWLEDLHWSDASTLDWIASFAQRPEAARLLLIATFRSPVMLDAGHPLAAICATLRARSFCRYIDLTGLDETAIFEYAALRFPPAPGEQEKLRRLARVIHRRTRGNALFVVNALRDVGSRGVLSEQQGCWTVNGEVESAGLDISDDVRTLIAQQLDRLCPAERALLEIASVAGAAFSAADVSAGSGIPLNEAENRLTALARTQQFVRHAGSCEWPDGTFSSRFDFIHVLYSDVLYESVPEGVRAGVHRRIGDREETAYGERAPEIAAELAMHFDRSRDKHRAGMYFQHAAANARRRCAFREAQMHFERALELIEDEPASSERTMRAAELTMGLGASMMATRGWSAPEVDQAYSRARVLCSALGDTPHRFPALWGCWLYYLARGSLATAQEIADELLALAHMARGDNLPLQAHHACWTTAFLRGEVGTARTHALEGIHLYRPEQHSGMAADYGCHDAQVCATAFVAWTAALRSHTDEAFQTSSRAIALARKLQHPFSIAHAEVFAAQIRHTLNDSVGTATHAAAVLEIAREHDFRLLVAWASMLQGWSLVEEGRHREGLEQIGRSLDSAQALGNSSFRSFFRALQAAACLKAGQVAEGLQSVDSGLAVVEHCGERFWESELHRLRAELQLAAAGPGAAENAEESLLLAIETARKQAATLLLSRAKLSLARLRSRRGRVADAG